ncbi:MAG TPA: RNase adapter RapZ [Alphaproteobacteria bacterium]
MSPRARLRLVTGLSGAGKSTALRALEDLGYEVVDNLPIKLVANLLGDAPQPGTALAVGVDARTRDFDSRTLEEALDALAARPDLETTLLFLDCDDEVLMRRYTETRRRHPLADDRPVSAGIRHERRLMAPVRARADHAIDTSEIAAAELGRILAGHYGLEARPGLRLFVTSFGFRHGLPREADLVLDVRFLRNPHYVAALRPLTGLDARVAAYVADDPEFAPFFDRVGALLVPLLPRYAAEGKAYLTIAIGCTGGRHRSVVVAARLAQRLGEAGIAAALHHRDLGRER